MLDQLLAEYQDLQFSVGGDAKEPSRTHKQKQQPKRAASAVDEEGEDENNAPARRDHRAARPPLPSPSMTAGEFTLDDLLAEYDDDDDGAKAKADKCGKADRPKVSTPADQMLAQREGEFTLDDLLADYDADAGAKRDATGRSAIKGQTAAGNKADRLASLGSTFTLDDLLSDYDGDKSTAASAKSQTQMGTAATAVRSAPAQQKRGEAWEDEWREDMARFGGAPEEREATLGDLIKTYQPPASTSSTKGAGVEKERTDTSKARVRKELQRFVQSMITEDVTTTLENSGVRDHVREAMQPLKATQASRRPRSAQQTPARHAEERHADGVEAAEMVTDDDDDDDVDDDDADGEEEEDLLENDDIDAELDDDKAFDALVAEAEEEDVDDDEDIKDDEYVARELESGRQVHPLEFSPLWRVASKHLPPRRTREEWERLGDGQIDPAFVGTCARAIIHLHERLS
jgi:hypothetical protein